MPARSGPGGGAVVLREIGKGPIVDMRGTVLTVAIGVEALYLDDLAWIEIGLLQLVAVLHAVPSTDVDDLVLVSPFDAIRDVKEMTTREASNPRRKRGIDKVDVSLLLLRWNSRMHDSQYHSVLLCD